MDYVQMTLDDWVEMKKRLRQELLGVKQSFVRIGYVLRQIEDQKLYEQDGYKSIAEFAKEEYGLEPSTTSRFMSINREYSIDGYSEQLRPEFADLGRSQLEEMLKLPDHDRSMIQPETSREDIRDLKRFNKVEPVAGVADDLRQLIEKFYQEHPEILNAIFSEPEFTEETIKRFEEIVNPGGNRSYKKGLYFLMMYENRVAVKKFGTDPRDLSWWEFWKITQDIFGAVAAGDQTWQNYFGGVEKEDGGSVHTGNDTTGDVSDNKTMPVGRENEVGKDTSGSETEGETQEQEAKVRVPETDFGTDREESSQREGEEDAGEQTNEPEGTESQGEEIAPAQKFEETLREEVQDETTEKDDLGGERGKTTETEAAEEEKEETESGIEAMNSPEILDKPFGSRKDWFDTLTIYGMANELGKLVRTMDVEQLENMKTDTFWQEWLSEEVDDRGRVIEAE